METTGYDAIVIGAGISGLCAAFNLVTSGQKVLLIEKESSVGGRAHSIHKDNFILEKGAVYIVFAGATLNKYVRLLGIPAGSLIKIRKKAAYFYNGKLHELNFSSKLSFIKSFLKSELITNKEKVNPKLLFFLINCIKSFRDIKKSYLNFSKYNKISARKYIQEYFDTNTTNKVFEPIAETFLFANLNDVSAAIFMVLIGAFLDTKNNILYPRDGIGLLAEKFYAEFHSKGGSFIKSTVNKIEKKGEFTVFCSSGEKFKSKTVICAIPLPEVDRIFPQAKIRRDFKEIRYVPMICCNIALSKPLQALSDNHLVFLETNKNHPVIFSGECTHKHSNVAPSGKGLLYISFSPKYIKKLLHRSETEIANIVDKQLANNFPDYASKKMFHKIFKWKNAFALTNKEYFNNLRVDTQICGFFVCGDSLYVGLDGVIESGEIAAKQAIICLQSGQRIH